MQSCPDFGRCLPTFEPQQRFPIPVHSCLLPHYCFLCLPLLLPPPTVLWGMVLAWPLALDLVVWPYHLMFSLNSREGRFGPFSFPQVFFQWRSFQVVTGIYITFSPLEECYFALSKSNAKNMKINVVR